MRRRMKSATASGAVTGSMWPPLHQLQVQTRDLILRRLSVHTIVQKIIAFAEQNADRKTQCRISPDHGVEAVVDRFQVGRRCAEALWPQAKRSAAQCHEIGGDFFRREHLLEDLISFPDPQWRGQRPGDDPAQERRLDVKAAKRLGRRRDELGDRGDQREPAGAFGMVEPERERDRAAQRMADNEGSAEI
jgi:hypothetical protein